MRQTIPYKEEPKYAGMRRRMVDQLRDKKVAGEEVLSIMNKIQRHRFIDKGFEEHAYDDKAFQIGAGQTISQPSTVAIQTNFLQLEKNEKVLEIGTGSGYQTAVLCEMGCKVFSIERQKQLFDKTKPFLEALGYRAKLFYGDGYAGLPAFAPFKKIIITCGAPFIPEALVAQLAPGGRMIIPLGDKVQIMNLVSKDLSGNVIVKEFGEFRFVPMLEKKVR